MKNFMKNFVTYLIATIIAYFLAPFYIAAISAWVWVPIIFSVFNFFGGYWLGLIIGLVVSIGTQVLVEMLPGN